MIFPYIGCKWNIVNFTNADMRKNWHTCWEMKRRKRETTISLSVLLLVLLKKQNRKRKEGWLNFSNGPSWFDWLVNLLMIPCKTTATRERYVLWCARVHVSLRVSRGLRVAYVRNFSPLPKKSLVILFFGFTCQSDSHQHWHSTKNVETSRNPDGFHHRRGHHWRRKGGKM